jgi:hypothetical protein
MGKYSIHSMSYILAMIHITEQLECTVAQLGRELLYLLLKPEADKAAEGFFRDQEPTSAEVE